MADDYDATIMSSPDDSSYLDSVRGQVPLYDALQDAAVAAVPFEPSSVLPAAPWTISIHASRVLPAAAVWASSVPAGIIESSSGNETAAPRPRKKWRRDKCFLVRYTISVP